MSSSITNILEAVRGGNPGARNALYESSYVKLRALAASLLRREYRNHSLQPTALVGELFLKLHGYEQLIMNEDHLYGMSARAMKQVLIDRARTRKLRDTVLPEDVPELLANHRESHPEMRLSVEAVFRKLESYDKEVASTVWMRCVEGLTLAELSKAQDRAVWRVRADFDFGLNWMAKRIRPAVQAG
jgi:RNA polymerase sigma factor (TIGR02999 family)